MKQAKGKEERTKQVEKQWKVIDSIIAVLTIIAVVILFGTVGSLELNVSSSILEFVPRLIVSGVLFIPVCMRCIYGKQE